MRMGHKQNNRAEGEGKERPLERQIQVVEKLVEKLTGMLEGERPVRETLAIMEALMLAAVRSGTLLQMRLKVEKGEDKGPYNASHVLAKLTNKVKLDEAERWRVSGKPKPDWMVRDEELWKGGLAPKPVWLSAWEGGEGQNQN